MDSVISVCAFALVAVCVIAIIRQLRAELVPFAVACASVVMLLYFLSALRPMLDFFSDSFARTGLSAYYGVMLKSLAIALACQMCAEICRDCGESALASKVELAGKISIMVISLPILKLLLQMVRELM